MSECRGQETVALSSGRIRNVCSWSLTCTSSSVDYGFCYPVNRSFTVCHPLTLLGLRALKRSFQRRDSLAPLSEKSVVTAHQNHTEFISVSPVVAEQRGWDRFCLAVIDARWAHDESLVCS